MTDRRFGQWKGVRVAQNQLLFADFKTKIKEILANGEKTCLFFQYICPINDKLDRGDALFACVCVRWYDFCMKNIIC